ncbi:MAG: hypothetical protein ACWA5X_07865, partial [bacterium]
PVVEAKIDSGLMGINIPHYPGPVPHSIQERIDKVYYYSQQVVHKVEALRKAMGVTGTVRTPPNQSHKTGMHLYGKTIEVMQKIRRTQSRVRNQENTSLHPVAVPSLSPIILTEGLMLDLTYHIDLAVDELLNVYGAEAVTYTVEQETEKSISDIYMNMWQLSYLFDDMADELDPDNVYSYTQSVRKDLQIFAQAADLKLTPADITPAEGKEPVDVNLVAFKNLHKIAWIEQEMGLPSVIVPNFPSGEISPSEVFDTVNTIATELQRLKNSANNRAPLLLEPLPTEKRPNDVYEIMSALGQDLDQLLKQLRD